MSLSRRGLLAADGYALLAGERVGIVTNPTGITADARHIVDVMHADDRVDLTAVFGPEPVSYTHLTLPTICSV